MIGRALERHTATAVFDPHAEHLLVRAQMALSRVKERIRLEPPGPRRLGASRLHSGACGGGTVESQLDLSLQRHRHRGFIPGWPSLYPPLRRLTTAFRQWDMSGAAPLPESS